MKMTEFTEEEIGLIYLALRECQGIYSTHRPIVPILIEDEVCKKLREASEKIYQLQEKIRTGYGTR